eukprot:scaffold24357_cov72-Skeletonema_dohrnii-CCMP3373.AAC.1
MSLQTFNTFDHHFANIESRYLHPTSMLHKPTAEKNHGNDNSSQSHEGDAIQGRMCLEKRFKWIVLREKGSKQCRELDAVEVRR